MYAPKFRSWMSSWDHFDEALEARLQAQGDAIMADVRRQIAEAMPKEPAKPEWQVRRDWYINELPKMLQASGMLAQPSQYPGAINSQDPWGLFGHQNEASSLARQLFGPGIDTRF